MDFSGAALGVFGHTHRSCDVMLRRTRLLSNAHGYGRGNPDFDPGLIVEVGA